MIHVHVAVVRSIRSAVERTNYLVENSIVDMYIKVALAATLIVFNFRSKSCFGCMLQCGSKNYLSCMLQCGSKNYLSCMLQCGSRNYLSCMLQCGSKSYLGCVMYCGSKSYLSCMLQF